MIIAQLAAFCLASILSATPAVPLVLTDAGSVAITAGPTLLAETSVAVDPTNSDHIVVLTDRYGLPTTIVMAESFDGGRGWSRGRPIVPPGFTTTYDSAVHFTSSGELIVAGGAARPTSPGCNADSSIFVADVQASGRLSYRLVRSVSGLNLFTDRPALAVDKLSGAEFVSWTESSGSLAACRGRPARSFTQVSRAERGETFSTPVRVPSSGLPAPYGSALALSDGGSLSVAVGEYGPSGISRLVVTESLDRGGTFTAPVVLATRPAVVRRWKWRGWVSAVPSLTAAYGRVAVSWVDTSGGRQTPMVFERTALGWVDVRPRTYPTGDVLLTTVRLGFDGTVWLASASISGSSIIFAIDLRRDGWGGPQAVASSPATLRELGELIGFDSAGSTMSMAVPIDAADRSAVVVFRASIA